MRLIWIVSGPLEQRGDRLFSALGSHRLRCLEPVAALARRGHRIALVRAETLDRRLASSEWGAADAVIVAKQFTDIAPHLQAVKGHGPRIVVDLCDDVLGLEHLRGTYARLLDVADACTAASPALAERIRAARNRLVEVVPDCVEGEARPPAFAPAPDRPPRLLWFGQPGNLDALDAALAEVGQRIPGATLDIVTRLSPPVTARFPDGRDGLSIRCLRWSIETMDKALHACDLVVIPSAPTDGTWVKSSNRVATALWAGRLPVAFPLPSYRFLAGSALLCEAMAEGVARALAQPEEMQTRIALGQALIRNHFTPDAVATVWEAVLGNILGSQSR